MQSHSYTSLARKPGDCVPILHAYAQAHASRGSRLAFRVQVKNKVKIETAGPLVISLKIYSVEPSTSMPNLNTVTKTALLYLSKFAFCPRSEATGHLESDRPVMQEPIKDQKYTNETLLLKRRGIKMRTILFLVLKAMFLTFLFFYSHPSFYVNRSSNHQALSDQYPACDFFIILVSIFSPTNEGIIFLNLIAACRVDERCSSSIKVLHCSILHKVM